MKENLAQRMKVHTLFVSLNTLIIMFGGFNTTETLLEVSYLTIIIIFSLIMLNFIYFSLMYESYARYIFRAYKENRAEPKKNENSKYDFFEVRKIDEDGVFSKYLYFQSLLLPLLFIFLYSSIMIYMIILIIHKSFSDRISSVHIEGNFFKGVGVISTVVVFIVLVIIYLVFIEKLSKKSKDIKENNKKKKKCYLRLKK